VKPGLRRRQPDERRHNLVYRLVSSNSIRVWFWATAILLCDRSWRPTIPESLRRSTAARPCRLKRNVFFSTKHSRILYFTRKPSWRKGKRATAFSVWNDEEEIYISKLTLYAIWWLIVTVAVLRTICKIFSRIEVESGHFAECILIVDPSGGKPNNINISCTSLKSTFSGLQFCCWHCGSIYIRSVVVAFQICEIARNSENIRTYSSSRSFKVTYLGVNRKSLHVIVTLDVSRTVLHILTHKARK